MARKKFDLKAAFKEAGETEFLEFDRIKDPPSRRPDLCAFLLLDRLAPGDTDIIAHAEHDSVWLGVDWERLQKEATFDDVVYLSRCGVRFDGDAELLTMFV